MLFKESINELESLVDMNELRNLTFDYTTEIIPSIYSYGEEDEVGVFRLAQALSTNFWSSAIMIKKDLKEESKFNNIESQFDQISNEINSNFNTKDKEKNYDLENKKNKELEPDSDTNKNYINLVENDDELIKKIIDIKNMNKNTNLTDEDRRQNAEKAMYSLYSMLGNMDLGEESEEEIVN